ncbi:hypothetical protein [Burkholderia gladioli]|jgi:hypothetical protein|uniref:hypothetical protein n=1 Tax=Burkholderia gladioli TaxID=28095 RepID=UPI000A808533|nr:hypothetical protein [Burkholderia gladioli]MBU9646085.1 hypothetical protein [Burkholderia gladioli]
MDTDAIFRLSTHGNLQPTAKRQIQQSDLYIEPLLKANPKFRKQRYQRASELRLFALLQEQNPSMYQRSSSHIYIAATTITRTKAPMRSS